MPREQLTVITRRAEDAGRLKRLLKAAGIPTYELPTIRIVKKELTDQEKAALLDLPAYDYLVFTSSNAAVIFMEQLKALGRVESVRCPRVVAVGEMTARTLQRLGLPVSLVPERFTSQEIVRELAEASGASILLPRSQIALPDLTESLRSQGAKVTELPLYSTLPIDEVDPRFCQLVEADQISCLTFTSPSSVHGFPGRLQSSIVEEKARRLPAVCIGPTTASFATSQGFIRVLEADPHTSEGMVQRVRELYQSCHALP